MKEVYAYIRVSTVRQGEKGTSLGEQRDAITAYAARNNIKILDWFEEQVTAAKQGRVEFARMMRTVKRKQNCGVIFHKIDRGARNLKDWSNIQDLIDAGTQVHFAHESLDMATRGGRLTADLLAVIASDYIRNLREEVKKGMKGRLKAGLYPLRAPVGYLDRGGGNPKVPDPERAPLIRKAFELYATGKYTLEALVDEMENRGLRSQYGAVLGINRLSELLRRSFYIGLIELKGDTYPGVHEPIVSKELFDRVQTVLDGKLSARPIRHDFTFRRMVRCVGCGYSLIGERQKGHVYYRCHTKGCPTKSIRESVLDSAIASTLAHVSFTREEAETLKQIADRNRTDAVAEKAAAQRRRSHELNQIENRLSRLTDLFIDGAVDEPLFQEKKKQLLGRQIELQSELSHGSSQAQVKNLTDFLELATDLQQSYLLADTEEKRQILNSTTSNLTLDGKKPRITLASPFQEIAECDGIRSSEAKRDRPRTFQCLNRICSFWEKRSDEE